MLAVFIFLQLDRKKGDITANDYDIVLCTNEMQDALFNYRNLLKNNYPSEETCEYQNIWFFVKLYFKSLEKWLMY